ncbi:MAG: hypothetical protein ACTHMI_21215 [Mucilaginibacter sp.]
MKFLVDANLPRNFKWFNTPDFVFAADWGASYPDKQIWGYALKYDLSFLSATQIIFIGSYKQSIRPK